MTEDTVLLVDDDTELTELLADYLEAEGLHISVADSAEAALALFAAGKRYDLAVFDIMMPGLSGLELLQAIRPANALPVIMLTGKGDDIDKILGLEMGADDYLAKPCNPRELLARIRAVLRRAAVTLPPDELPVKALSYGAIVLDPAVREVRFQNELIELTGAEFNVLHLFMQHPGVVLSKAELTEKVLHRPLTAYDRAMDVHVSRVRQKLLAATGEQGMIKTLRGEGYMLVRETA